MRDDIAADIARIDRDLASRTKAGENAVQGDGETIDALLDARHRLTELAKGLTAPTASESIPEGTS